jgi:hypothetical protein
MKLVLRKQDSIQGFWLGEYFVSRLHQPDLPDLGRQHQGHEPLSRQLIVRAKRDGAIALLQRLSTVLRKLLRFTSWTSSSRLWSAFQPYRTFIAVVCA